MSEQVSAAGAVLSDKVVRWQKAYGRHGLPWQGSRDPYHVWLSEIMLQQTQVATVIPYYQRFLQRFPDIHALAAASLNDVLTLWSGLGYYSRARSLHRAAQTIQFERGGRFPTTHAEILALPGIGRSTAAAICVFAFGGSEAILDGNVKRLFARRFAIPGYPGNPDVAAALWREAEQCLPSSDIEAYTQGLMDLGATVCTRVKPRCDACPLAEDCIAFARQAIKDFPAPRPRVALPQRQTRMLILLHGHEVLLEKRAPTGIWGGLWSFPEVGPAADIVPLCAGEYGAEIGSHEVLSTVSHAFTHFKLDIVPQRLIVKRLAPHAAQPRYVWLSVDDALRAAIPAPVKRILTSLAGGKSASA